MQEDYRMRTIFALVAVAACAAAHADSPTDTVTLTGETTISSSTTYNARITGSGSFKVTNGATLTLNHGTNDFTGGVVVESGELYTRNALNNTSTFAGTGDVTLNCTGNRKCQWIFHSVLDNNIVINGNSSATYPATDQVGGGTIRGTVTANGDWYIGSSGYDGRSDSMDSEKVAFNGVVNAAGHKISVASHMLIRFGAAITCDTLEGRYRTVNNSTAKNGVMGGYTLRAANNVIGTIRLDHQKVWCYVNNAVNGAALVFEGQHAPATAASSNYSSETSYINLNRSGAGSFTQTFKSISSDAWPRGTAVGYEIRNTTGTAATLKITGAADTSATCYVAVNNKVNVLLAAPSTYRQTFLDRASLTTGNITVTGGELELGGTATFASVPAVTVSGGGLLVNSTLAGSLAGVKSVDLSGTGALSFGSGAAAPFTDALATLSITGSDAQITSASPVTWIVKSLTVDGVQRPIGRYTSANLANLGANVTILAATGSGGASDLAWIAQGTDEKTSTAGNWDLGGETPDFSTMQYVPVFSAGSRALVDGTMWVAGLTFDAPAPGFALAPLNASSSIATVGGTAFTCVKAAEGAAARTTEISVPIEIIGGGKERFVVNTNETLRITGGITGSTQLVTDGFGTIEFAGLPDFAGGIRITNVHARMSGMIGTPDNANDLILDWKRVGAAGVTTRGYLYLSNTVCNLRFVPGGTGVSVDEDYHWLSVAPGTTNIFEQGVLMGSSEVFENDDGAALVFRKGRTTIGLGTGSDYTLRFRNLHTKGNAYGPAVFRFEGPLSLVGNGGTKRSLAIDSENMKVEFACTGNCMSGGFQVANNVVYETLVDDALTTNAWFRSSGTGSLLLGSTHQQIGYLNDCRGLTISGTYPATLEMRAGGTSAETSSKCLYQTKFSGWVGLAVNTIAKDNICQLTGVKSASYGDITVTRGVLAFNAASSWLNGTNVTVGAEGTLKIASANTFNKDVAVLHLAEGGTIDIPAGVTQVFAKGWLGNTPLRAGSRHATGSVSYVTGGGAFRIAGGGMTILFR